MCKIGLSILALVMLPVLQEHWSDVDITRRESFTQSLEINTPTTAPNKQLFKSSAMPVDTNQLLQSPWYTNVIRAIETGEYDIKPDKQAGVYTAPNRNQNLRAFYSASSFKLQPRKDSIDSWSLQLTTAGVYAGDQLIYRPDEDPQVIQKGNTIQFHHQGNFITEYINNEAGVRQNFIIERAPMIEAEIISVQLSVNDGWFVNKVNKEEIHFARATENGYDKKITYNQLKVWDANNKALDASFSVNGNIISIDVNGEDAAYPITIDPVSSTANVMLESNQDGALMGRYLSSAGDVNGDGYSDVIVGAALYDNGQTDEGAAFIYHGSATGISATLAIILECNQAGAGFGTGVSGAGDINGDGYGDIVVGALLYDNGQTDEGAAFVYYGSASGISATPAAILESNQANGQMGFSSHCAGDVNGDGYSDIIVGAFMYDNGQTDEGVAFMYHGSATGIVTTAAVILESNFVGAFFGREVGGAGDVNGDGYGDVIVGAYGYNNGQVDEGAAFIFHGSSTGINAAPALILESNQTGAAMGISLASAGDVNGDGYSDVIVGAYFYDNTIFDEGAAFIYHGSISGVNPTPVRSLYGKQAESRFGAAVASAGDVNGDGYSDIIIGAYFYDNGQTDEGATFVYYGSSTGIPDTSNALLEPNQANTTFGIAIASAGDVNGDGYSDLLIGAMWYDNGQTDEGAAFIYHGSPDGLSVAPLVINNITQNQSGFGYGVTTAGDVNSDGFSDVIISAPWFDDNGGNEGRAFVYYGSTSGISITANVVLDEANQGAAYFGYSLGTAGDVNGDGFSDVIVGAFGYNGKGRAYVYFGSGSGLSATSNQVLDGTQSGEGFGVSVATAGDVNHDGYSDVVIGAYSYDDGANADEGRALIYHGSSAGLITTPVTIISDANQPGASFGFSASTAGDVNGDGYSDIIIGSHGYDKAGSTDEGAVFVYYGSCTGIPAVANLIITGAAQATAYYGFSVSPAGDINGDGFTDVIVGSFFYNNQKGRAYIYYGSSAGLSSSSFPLDNTPVGNNNGDRMGYSVSTAGDINGDGYSDIIVGVAEYNNPGSGPAQGRAFIYLGKATGVNAAPDIIITDNVNNQQFFGHTVGAAGDVNGDGFSDIVVGGYKGSWSGFGMAWIFKGNNIGGLRNNLRLYNTNLSTPMNQSNINDASSFGAGLYAKSFLGKQKGKLVWQTIANGNTFTGSPITNSTQYTAQQSAYTNLGLNGAELKTVVTKTTVPATTYTRVRVKYDPVTSITGQVYGPWRYPAGYQQGSRAIADVAMSTLTVRLGNDTAVCFPYTINATINGATSYSWQNNANGPTFNATVSGLYWVEIVSGGCTYRDSIVLSGFSPTLRDLYPIICQNQNYTAPSGNIFKTAGIYKDTLRSAGGCDSVINTIDLAVLASIVKAIDAKICAGQTYTLPSGKSVTVAGMYTDTIRYKLSGCDSLITNTNLSVTTVSRLGQTAIICSGSSYRLPSGKNVSTAAIYQDTLKAQAGCDSVIHTIDLRVDVATITNRIATICTGNSYLLPGGKAVSVAGLYRDTLRNVRGCDSLITNVTLRVDIVTIQPINAYFFTGQTYTLPWGRAVTAGGIYRDTARSIAGCDSLIKIVDLKELTVQSNIRTAVICAGGSYTLPWGGSARNTGSYTDTIKSVTGADSLLNIVDLTVLPGAILTPDSTVCRDATVTLRALNALSYAWTPAAGLSNVNNAMTTWTATTNTLFRLTTTHTNPEGGTISCTDSVRITVQAKIVQSQNRIICAGQTYTLPSGKAVTVAGMYADTVRYLASGCDSLITNVTLTVQGFTARTLQASFCQGGSYTLPSGRMVAAAGSYTDTLRYTTGCDSVRFSIQLTRHDATVTNRPATICGGTDYQLPSGRRANASGIYRDTLRYGGSGCDSSIFNLTLTVLQPTRLSSTAYICAGSTYTLPSGKMISAAGIYPDTLRSVLGCDSIIHTISLVVDGVTRQSITPAICEGRSYRLPSGRVVQAAGTYYDTLRNIRGCDSIAFTIGLAVNATRYGTASATLCAGQVYTLPSGKTATQAGSYSDTIRSAITGCDSVVTVALTYRNPIMVTLSGPATVCTGVSATLTATASGGNGGPYTYTWTGATGSGNTLTVNPTATTPYKVSVADGCTVAPATDSITVQYIPPPQPGLNNQTVTICLGSSTNLTATGGATYQWSPALGLSDPNIANPQATPLTDTRYRVRATTATGCVGEDSILVRVTQPFTLTTSRDTLVCSGNAVTLSATGAQRYQWSGAGLSGTTTATVTARPAATTTYTVTGRGPDACFEQTRQITVTVIPLPVVNAGRDTTIMVGTGFEIRPTYSNGVDQYRWSPPTYLSCTDCATPTLTPREPMEYTITVRDGYGCQSADRIRIELLCNAESIFLPNTFTPNGDGVNDIWYPRGGGIKQVRYLKVFNRWGQLIFERTNFNTDDRNAGWDGTFKSQALPPDVFVYTMGVTCDNGQAIEARGNVMIVR